MAVQMVPVMTEKLVYTCEECGDVLDDSAAKNWGYMNGVAGSLLADGEFSREFGLHFCFLVKVGAMHGCFYQWMQKHPTYKKEN